MEISKKMNKEKVNITVTGENGDNVEFSYKFTSLAFLDVVYEAGKIAELDEQDAAEAVIKVYGAIKKLLGKNYDKLVSLYEAEGTELEFSELMQLVVQVEAEGK